MKTMASYEKYVNCLTEWNILYVWKPIRHMLDKYLTSVANPTQLTLALLAKIQNPHNRRFPGPLYTVIPVTNLLFLIFKLNFILINHHSIDHISQSSKVPFFTVTRQGHCANWLPIRKVDSRTCTGICRMDGTHLIFLFPMQ